MTTMKNSIFTIFLLMFAYVQVWAGSGDERWPNYVAIAGNTGANPSEDYPYLLDNNSNTKWCVTGVSGTIYIEFDTTSPLTQLLRFILVFLANQRFVFLICFTVFYKF